MPVSGLASERVRADRRIGTTLDPLGIVGSW
jgi:hypothetical protein